MKRRLVGLVLVGWLVFSGFRSPLGASAGAAAQTPTPGTTPTQDGAGASINPLTGLPVSKPENLLNPPALVSVTNWPHTARPQAGLSFSPMVFELYIGEGMSRFLAMFYGDYPQAAVQQNPAVSNSGAAGGSSAPAGTPAPTSTPQPVLEEAAIGPIRSGRLPYEHLRTQYSGFLIMASAAKGVTKNLAGFTNVFGSDADNINSAMIKVTQIEAIARSNQSKLGQANLSGMAFDAKAPEGGVDASRLWYMYNPLNQMIWKYDAASGVYLRYQFTAEKKNRFIQAVDRLNGEPLAYENVVVLYADHRMCTDTAFDVDLSFVKRMPALLFRDGKMYKIFWTTKNEEYEKKTGRLRPIRFVDEKGNPFPMKPGQTWVHLTPLNTPYWETPDSPVVEKMLSADGSATSDLLYDLVRKKQSGTGLWATRFAAYMMAYDQAVCDQLSNK